MFLLILTGLKPRENESKLKMRSRPLGKILSDTEQLLESCSVHPMAERLKVVNCYNRYIKLIFQEELTTGLDVHFLKRESALASGGANRLLRFVTQMTSRTRVNNHMRF